MVLFSPQNQIYFTDRFEFAFKNVLIYATAPINCPTRRSKGMLPRCLLGGVGPTLIQLLVGRIGVDAFCFYFFCAFFDVRASLKGISYFIEGGHQKII